MPAYLPADAFIVMLLMVAAPLVVLVEAGVAPASVLPKEILTVSLPVVMLLLYWSWAWIVTLKAAPTVCGEPMADSL